MRAVLLLVSAALYAQDARDILKQALERDQRNFEVLNTYMYEEKSVVKFFEKDGRVKDTKVNVDEIFHVDGSEIKRRILKDGRALSAKEQESEQRKVDKEIAKIKSESPKERAKRRGETDKDKKEELEGRREILEAYDLKLLGSEVLNGRECWKLAGTPKPGFKGKGRRADQIEKLKGMAWIDKSTYEWVRMELTSIDTISFGFFILRLQPNAQVKIEQIFVNGEVWLPQKVDIRADARVLGKMSRIGVEVTYANFRKFTSDSKLVTEIQ